MGEKNVSRQRCLLPFYGINDLAKKCETILAALREYQGGRVLALREAGIPFVELSAFGMAINWDDIKTEEQKKLVINKEEFEAFISAFCQQYNIIDDNNTLITIG